MYQILYIGIVCKIELEKQNKWKFLKSIETTSTCIEFR